MKTFYKISSDWHHCVRTSRNFSFIDGTKWILWLHYHRHVVSSICENPRKFINKNWGKWERKSIVDAFENSDRFLVSTSREETTRKVQTLKPSSALEWPLTNFKTVIRVDFRVVWTTNYGGDYHAFRAMLVIEE